MDQNQKILSLVGSVITVATGVLSIAGGIIGAINMQNTINAKVNEAMAQQAQQNMNKGV